MFETMTFWKAMLVAALLAGGCASAQEIRLAKLQSFRAVALPRVAFELECPASDITVTELTPPDPLWLGTVMGVSGCGKRAVYVLSASGWVNNTREGDQKPRDAVKP